MNITADTNVLVRAVIADPEEQRSIAIATLRGAEIIAVTIPSLCEFVWVLSRGYKVPREDVASAIEVLIGSAVVRVDRAVVEAGIAQLRAGGDFADAVIALDGARLGGTVFASFDRAAVKQIRSTGGDALLLGGS